MGYLGLIEEDYAWITRHLVRVANTFCEGRVVSVLEGGYRIEGGVISAFARSVAAHVRSLVEGTRHREGWSEEDLAWEEGLERRQQENRIKKMQERMAGMMGLLGNGVEGGGEGENGTPVASNVPAAADVKGEGSAPEEAKGDEGGGGGRRKRRAASGNVDYVALMKKMKEEEARLKAEKAGVEQISAPDST
jgi:hypothetical protein